MISEDCRNPFKKKQYRELEGNIMYMYKVIKQSLLTLLFLVCSFNALAETDPYVTFETHNLKIKLSNDGTGIVQGIQCSSCDYNIVKITRDSKFTNEIKKNNVRMM